MTMYLFPEPLESKLPTLWYAFPTLKDISYITTVQLALPRDISHRYDISLPPTFLFCQWTQ